MAVKKTSDLEGFYASVFLTLYAGQYDPQETAYEALERARPHRGYSVQDAIYSEEE